MNADSPEAINQTQREHLDLSLPKDAYATIKKIIDRAEGDVAKILRSGLSSYILVATKPPNLNQSPDKVYSHKIYRYVLPIDASQTDKELFERQVTLISRSNPDWIVERDRVRAGEEQAVIIIHKDNHLQSEAAYIITRSLSELLEGL